MKHLVPRGANMRIFALVLLAALTFAPGAIAQDAEAGLGKFPGVGSIDAWRTSRPETQAGYACMKNKRWDDAIRHFKATLDLYEYQPRVWIQMGRAIEERGGDLSEVEKCYRKSLKLDAENWHGWKCLANVLYVQKRYGESREALASALQLKVPPKELGPLQKMVERVDSAAKNADTKDINETSN